MGCDPFLKKKRTRRQGVTLVELVLVIVVLAILSAAGSAFLGFLVQNSVFIPNQLNMDMAAVDALDIMIDGDSQAKGLRFSRAVTNVQNYQITFTNQDSQSVRYRLDTTANKLYRSINGAAETLLPFYVGTGVNVLGKNNRLFAYYDAAGAVTATPANVRWITMALIARTGTGLYSEWEGQSEQSTSVAVSRFQ